MVVDYERAWIRLSALVAGKSQHGREGLLRDMAKIADECQVPEGERERWLRLFGIDVSRTVRPQSIPDTGASSSRDDGVAGGTVSRPGHPSPQGGHDGHIRNGRERAPETV
jgi:hypothetical protein